jgi:hypothetical protein
MLNYCDLYNKAVESTSFTFMFNKAGIYLQNLDLQEHYYKYFEVFSYDHLLNYIVNTETLYAYKLLMKTPLVKFKSRFSFGRLSYEEYKPMLENVF